MKVPGYIEGPYGRFPPYAKKSRSSVACSVDLDSDIVVESGRRRLNLRNQAARPGRAERIYVHDMIDNHDHLLVQSLPTVGFGVTRLPALNFSTAFLGDSTVVRQVFNELGQLAQKNSMPDVPTAEKRLDIDLLLRDAIEGESDSGPHDVDFSQPRTVAIPGPARPATFFSKLPATFRNVVMDNNTSVPTGPFLDACHEIPKILDMIGSRALGAVKADINGNITKLRSHHGAFPVTTGTLQEIVINERNLSSPVRPSPTEALLWLKRSLTFMDVFLMELLTTTGKETLDCASVAYKTALHPHHNFVVRSVVWAALYGLPSRKDIFLALSETKEAAGDAVFADALMEDAREYSATLHGVVDVLNRFYVDEKLDKL